MPNLNILTTKETITSCEHLRFPSIESYKSFEKDLLKELPTEQQKLTLVGTVKLHGTHADIVYRKRRIENDLFDVYYQSRNRVLSKEEDNCGFVAFMEKVSPTDLMGLFTSIESIYKNTSSENITTLMISGEFCGGRIQKRVAISQLEKMFVIFSLKINDRWMDMESFGRISLEPKRIYNIQRSWVYIEEYTPGCEKIVQRLTDITDRVEKECPFGKSFNVSGLGEGIVWVCKEKCSQSRFWFKVKGEEHAISRGKTVKEQTPEEKERMQEISYFVDGVVTRARLEQGLDYLREMNLALDMKNMSTFLKWVVEDVIKEESDDMQELGLDVGKVKKAIVRVASNFYKERV